MVCLAPIAILIYYSAILGEQMTPKGISHLQPEKKTIAAVNKDQRDQKCLGQ
jgi:hypothetical protein